MFHRLVEMVVDIKSVFVIMLLVLNFVNHWSQAIGNVTSSRKQLPDVGIVSFDDIVSRKMNFNISDRDTIAILHIQKTAGTAFERNLVRNLELKNPCSCHPVKRECLCARSTTKLKNETEPQKLTSRTWLISRSSTGWICGLHPDWLQLNYCLQGLDRIYLVTILRHPVHRFVSEFRHVQRGATWKASHSHCKDRDTKTCLRGREDWSNVTMNEFLGCRGNMAINRQTHMLADYRVVGCRNDDPANWEMRLLSSAMKNLEEISYFGLCERQRDSQIIFEKTFGLKFKLDFKQSEDNTTRLIIEDMPKSLVDEIIQTNHLDMQLYQFATKLFEDRHKLLGSTRPLIDRCGILN